MQNKYLCMEAKAGVVLFNLVVEYLYDFVGWSDTSVANFKPFIHTSASTGLSSQ